MKKPILLLLLFLLLALLLTSAARAQPAPGTLAVPPAMLDRIDREAEATLARLYRLSPPAQALVARAFGVLVVPGLRADGGILGVAYGRGVLIEASGERTYYNVIAGPAGAILGLDGKAVVLFFSAHDALRAFLAGPGWIEGENGTIQILDESAMAGPRAPTVAQIAGFILSTDRLLRGLSLSGSQFIKVPLVMCGDAATACAGDRASR
jgi:lipid-binding SYLF domain-containing protein